MIRQSASEVALAGVGAVRDDPAGRLALMRGQYRVPPDVDRGYLPSPPRGGFGGGSIGGGAGGIPGAGIGGLHVPTEEVD